MKSVNCILLICSIVLVGLSNLCSQNIMGSESFKLDGIRLNLTIKDINKDSSCLDLIILNQSLSSIYIDSSYFLLSTLKEGKKIRESIFGQGFNGVYPMNLKQIKSFDSYSIKIPLTKFEGKAGIDGHVFFIKKKSLRKFCKSNGKSFESCEPNTNLIDFHSTIIFFEDLKPAIKWSYRGDGKRFSVR